MQKIDLKNINKSNWETFRFEEIASKISETVDPNSTTLEIYVGLEHIDAEDIHIRRNGTPDDVSGGKLKCYPGDVIFGKRRAYQRKAAIVDFEGICSAHAFVFRANEEVIDRKLFPFFLHSDQFMHRMVDISVGGLSPTLNWGDLKHQEFLLPPKDQQAQLAELLWAMDEVIEREREVLEALIVFKKVKRENLIIQDNLKWVKLEGVCEKRISYGIVQAGPHIENGMPYIKSSDLSEYGINPIKLQRTSNEIAEKYKRSEVVPGDIVFSLRGNLGEMNFVPMNLKTANLTQGTARLNIKETFNANYVKHALETVKVQTRIHALSKGSTFKEISLEALRTVKIPIPLNRNGQGEISLLLDTTDNSIKHSKLKISSSQSLQKSLINQIF